MHVLNVLSIFEILISIVPLLAVTIELVRSGKYFDKE